MKNVVAAFFIWVSIAVSVSQAQIYEARAFWVVRDGLISEESITEMVDRVVRSNCNMIFVQVCGRGEAYYESRILPQAEPLALRSDRFDPLESAIDKAHEQGLQVHAWVNVYIVWSAPDLPEDRQHVLHLHPDWVAHTNEGRSLLEYERPFPFGIEGIFLSPGHPAVKDWIAEVIGEIVARYDVDGIHLDYLRYPNRGTGFNPQARARFMEKYHFDPIHLAGEKENLKSDSGFVGGDNLDRLWNRWRCQQLTETVQMVRDRIRAARPEVKLSAAVKPDYDLAVRKFGQDWKRWMDEGLLDFVVVMAYSPTTTVVVRQIEQARRMIRTGSLFAGLGVYNQPAFSTVQQIAAVRRLGVEGISLFSYNSIADDEAYFRTLKEGCFQQVAAMPVMAPIKR